MSFIRTKEIPPKSGRYYLYEVENKHINGKVKQKHLRYLGRAGGKVSLKPLLADLKTKVKQEKRTVIYQSISALSTVAKEELISLVKAGLSVNEIRDIINIRYKCLLSYSAIEKIKAKI